jgi:predicted hotdog family 3-hydroxylacyl-ACP dehydratase
MCLLERVDDWSRERIHCSASSHRLNDNPLRAEGRLGAACGIEYAAQAMAVHGALVAPPGSAPRPGFLASVRGVELFAERLDDIDADLEIEAEQISGDGNNVLYSFVVRSGDRQLLAGRAAVVLDGGAS